MKRRMWVAAVVTAAALSPTTEARAADAEGRFAGHGWAAGQCSALVTAVADEDSVDRPLFVGWIGGYLTAANAYREDTFDIAPLAPPEIVANFLVQQCEQNPDAAVVEVMVALVNELAPQRLRSGEPVLQVAHEGRTVRIHQEIFRRTQSALSELGFYDGAVDGAYGPQSRRALTRFQEARGLQVTGLPDDRTLLSLFFSSGEPASGSAVPGSGDG